MRDYGPGARHPPDVSGCGRSGRMKTNRARGLDPRNDDDGIRMKSTRQKLPSPGRHAWSNQGTRQDDDAGWLDVKTVPPIPEAKTAQMGSDVAQGGLGFWPGSLRTILTTSAKQQR